MENSGEYTLERRLLEVNKAIEAVLLGGQSVKIGTRRVERADLSALRAMRDDLEAQMNEAAPSPLLARTYAVFFEGR